MLFCRPVENQPALGGFLRRWSSSRKQAAQAVPARRHGWQDCLSCTCAFLPNLRAVSEDGAKVSDQTWQPILDHVRSRSSSHLSASAAAQSLLHLRGPGLARCFQEFATQATALKGRMHKKLHDLCRKSPKKRQGLTCPIQSHRECSSAYRVVVYFFCLQLQYGL